MLVPWKREGKTKKKRPINSDGSETVSADVALRRRPPRAVASSTVQTASCRRLVARMPQPVVVCFSTKKSTHGAESVFRQQTYAQSPFLADPSLTGPGPRKKQSILFTYSPPPTAPRRKGLPRHQRPMSYTPLRSRWPDVLGSSSNTFMSCTCLISGQRAWHMARRHQQSESLREIHRVRIKLVYPRRSGSGST